MKRLKAYFSRLERNDTTYEMIYTGAYAYTKDGIIYGNPNVANVIFDPVYKEDDIKFAVERSHRLTLDKPCITVRIPISNLTIINSHMNDDEKTVVADYALRKFNILIDEFNDENFNRKRTHKESGMIYSYHPGNEVLMRNAAYITEMDQVYFLNILVLIQLPLHNHKKGMNIMCKVLPGIVKNFINQFNLGDLHESMDLFLLQQKIRNWLETSPYSGFIANNSILPRDVNGIASKIDALFFESPKAYEIEIFGHKGMGIPKGIVVITGGGYSGKSTLLDAIAAGIYNHVAGDGRELCITNTQSIKITAEDGRCINNVDISPFIKWIPNKNPEDFSTTHASGSISQAANIMEAINMGVSLFLIDEDKTAANFMFKDPYMKEILANDPIVPFFDRIRQLYRDMNISCILVIGSNSEYLYKADHVLLMDEYTIYDINDKIKKSFNENHDLLIPEIKWNKHKVLISNSLTNYPKESICERMDISEFGFVIFGEETVDIRVFDHLSEAQIHAIVFIMREISKINHETDIDLHVCIDKLLDDINIKGIDNIFSTFFAIDRWLEIPRKIDVLSVIYRMKNIKLKVIH